MGLGVWGNLRALEPLPRTVYVMERNEQERTPQTDERPRGGTPVWIVLVHVMGLRLRKVKIGQMHHDYPP